MNFDDIFLTKSEYRTLKLYAKNSFSKNQLPEYTNSLILKGLVETAHATDTETSERFIVCRITEQGKAYLEWRKAKRKTFFLKYLWIPIALAIIAFIFEMIKILLCNIG